MRTDKFIGIEFISASRRRMDDFGDGIDDIPQKESVVSHSGIASFIA